MNDDLDFEYPVVEAINSGKKIEAIKLLRESRNIGLKDAKELVDAYCEKHEIRTTSAPPISGNSLILIVFIICIVYLGYRFLA